ncbi:MAG: hypothetical protein ACTSYD_13675 [Candidatus Heimdallarchaeaceae archaeon]
MVEMGFILAIIAIAGTMLGILVAGFPLASGIRAASAAVAEKRKLNTYLLIYLALGESLAIYSLLIAFMMFSNIRPVIEQGLQAEVTVSDGVIFLGVMFIMLVATIGASIALSKGIPAAIGSITADPGTSTLNLIYLGLGEALAIYGLLIAFLVLGLTSLPA